MTLQLPIWVWPTALMAVCALALWRGRDDERLAAAGMLANWSLSRILFKNHSNDLQAGVFAVDVVLLGLYLWLALRSRRYWPLFGAGFWLLAIITHVGRLVDPRMSGWAYLTAEIIWSYLVLWAIAYGAWTAPAAYARIDGAAANPGGAGATRR